MKFMVLLCGGGFCALGLFLNLNHQIDEGTTATCTGLLFVTLSQMPERATRKPEKRMLRHGEPCSHKGCEFHVYHRCEGCDRFMALGCAYATPRHET